MCPNFVLLLLLPLLQPSIGNSITAESNQAYRMSGQLEHDCEVYAHEVLKPMMTYFDQVNRKIDKNDAEMAGKNEQLHKMENEVSQLRVENASLVLKDKMIKVLEDKDESNGVLIKSLQQQIDLSKLVNSEKVKKLEIESKNQKEIMADRDQTIHRLQTEIETMKNQIMFLNNSKEQQNKDIVNLNAKINQEAQKVVKCEADLKTQKDKEIQKKKSRSCVANLPGVHNITLSNNHTFEVLCNSDIAGSGWTVIQQRINGGVDFYRDWVTYRNGFGAFWDGDFFLGLEKIHSLTSDQPHELYIHMQNFDGSTIFARYDDFAISGEDDKYRLIKLGRYSGNLVDSLRSHQNQPFSTYDLGKNDGYCATIRHGGWWYYHCAECNLNGRYYSTGEKAEDSNYWIYGDYKPLKEVRMMIRSRAD